MRTFIITYTDGINENFKEFRIKANSAQQAERIFEKGMGEEFHIIHIVPATLFPN